MRVASQQIPSNLSLDEIIEGTEMKIAYLGLKDLFRTMWCRQLFTMRTRAFSNITDVIKAYEQGLVDYSGSAS